MPEVKDLRTRRNLIWGNIFNLEYILYQYDKGFYSIYKNPKKHPPYNAIS